jgi:hypothetical protein
MSSVDPRHRRTQGLKDHVWISSSRTAASTRPLSRASVPRRKASTFSCDIAREVSR